MRERPVVVLAGTLILLAIVFAAGLIGVSLGAQHSREQLKDQATAQTAAIRAELEQLKATAAANDAVAAARIDALSAALRHAGVDPATVVTVTAGPTSRPASAATPHPRPTPQPAPKPTPSPSRTPRPTPRPTCTRLPVVDRCLR